MINKTDHEELLLRLNELEAENQLLKRRLSESNGFQNGVDISHIDKAEYGSIFSSKLFEKQRELMFKIAFETSGDAFLIHDQDGNFLEFTPRFCSLVGYSREELWGFNVQDIDDSSYSKLFKDRIKELRKNGAQLFETSIKPKYGPNVPVEVSASIVEIENRKAYLVAIRDIRLRKEAERKLRDSESTFRSLIENSPDLIMRFDRNYRHLYVNSASSSILKMEPDVFIGKTHEELGFPIDMCHFWEEYMVSVFESGLPQTVEFSLLQGDEELFFEWRLIPEFEGAGNVVTLLAVARDITKRRIAEKELVESETRLKLAMDGASESLWDWNIQENRIECNDQLFQMLGYHRSQIPDLISFFSKINHPQDWPIVKRAYIAYLNGDCDVFEVEHRLLDAKGQYIWFLERGKIVQRTEGGVALRALGTCVNINDLKTIQGQLNDAVVSRDKFFSIIAHDLKNPFNALLGFSSLLKDSSDALTEEQIQECLDLIHSSAEQGYNLLENLLEWSRSQMGKIKWNPTQINLKPLLDNNMELHRAKAREKNIEFTLDASQISLAWADEYMVDTVLRNLISNALKFTYEGGEVKVVVVAEDAFWIVEVRDNGIGISEKNISKLFKLESSYTRMGTSDEKGTGLGLILCNEFILKNKGSIWVESKEGKGSCFKFSLPRF